MAESRDRLIRHVDLAEVLARRRSGSLGVSSDEARRILGVGGAVRGRQPLAMGLANDSSRGLGRGALGTPRNLRTENTPLQRSAGRGRGRTTLLPSWYPRTPLRDITSVVRAIERTRARLGDVGGQQTESPQPQNQRVVDSTVQLSGVQLEHELSTPAPSSRKKTTPPSVRKVQKILHDITKQNAGDSEHLTPQKKLLNSIDTVEKAVKDELRRLKRSPSAKKAEREKKVKTLMSMR